MTPNAALDFVVLDCTFHALPTLPRPTASPSRSSAPPATRKAATLARASANVVRVAPNTAAAASRANQYIVYALGASIAIHAVLLAIRFRPFDPTRLRDRTPPLEVALVNAKSKTKPVIADILAQANLDGGGNTEANRRAKTPLPVLPKASPTGEIAVASQKLDVLEQEARELMTRIKSAPTAPAMPKPVEAPEPVAQPSVSELTQRTLEAIRLEARVAKDIEVYQQRPKRRFVGARAEEYRLAR